jgi:TolB-like protein/Flp pilus assembly protein TadD
MSDLTVKTLGGVSFHDDQGELRLPTRKALALLVYLGLSPRGSRSREHLASVFWGRSADEQSRASLRQTLSSLRKALGEQANLLESDAESVGVQRDRFKIDALEFEVLANSASQTDLERAAEMYQGAFLEGFSLKEEDFEEWLTFTRQQYNELALQLFTRLVEQHRMLQEYETAIRYAQRLLSLDPLQEQTHRLLMELFARLGRREQAQLQYDDCERILKREFDVAPAAETRALYASIKAGGLQRLEADTDGGADSSAQAEFPPKQEAITTTGETQDRKPSDKTVIVVLPFDNLSGDPGQDYFSAGITKDIITELSRFRSLSVIARSSPVSIGESEFDHLGIATPLAADYVVEGSVQRANNTVRISAQLVEAVSGEHVWANRYDREIEDIFSVQDEVTRMIVATVGGRLADHRVKSGNGGTRDWSVYDLILRAQAEHYRILKPSNEEAYDILELAQEQDPDNGRVHSLLGAVLLLDYTMNWSASPAETLDLALMHGRKAVRLDNMDSLAHARLGETLLHFRKFNEARRHFIRALELNPNDTESRALYSLYWLAMGDAERSLLELETVRQIDPFERIWIPWCRGEALFMAQRYEEAIESLEEVTEPINDRGLTLAASYANLGDLDTAKHLLTQYLFNARQEMPNFPGVDFSDWIELVKVSAGYQNDDHHRLLTEALRKAWPDEDELIALSPDTPKMSPTAAPSVPGASSSKPSIAVLPFDNLSGDPSQQFLVDAITEDLVSNLAHDLWFDVIARTSTQKFRDDKSSTAEIASELGVHYIVDGSLRKSDDRIRFSVVLIDGSDGKQIWNQRYDRVATDLFELQDEIAISIAAAVIPEVNTAEQRSAMRKHPQNLDAWSSCHKAFWHLYTFELPQLELAQSLFEKAIEHDPSYSQPYAGLAYSQMMTLWYDSSKKDLLETANQNARRAIYLDNRDSYAHFALGRILSMQHEFEEATMELKTAIELNPSFGRAYFGLASVAVYAGNYAQALEPIDTAIRLSPADPHLWTFYNIKSRARVGLGKYEEAEYWARKAVRLPSATFWSDLALVSTLGYLGRENEARLAIQDLYRKKPGYSLEQYARDDFVLTPAAHQVVVEGLRKAGLPERNGKDKTVENKPSIAVLPFSNLSGDPAQQYFSDGFSEEVLNGLTRIRSFKIIARNSSFALRDSSQSAPEIGRQLGARYLVNGSLRKAVDQLRIAVQLVDSETDSQIWSDRYDGALDDIFDLQDQISAAVIGAIEPKIRTSEIDKTRRAVHLGAYELYLKALSLVYEMTRMSTDEALSLLNQAIQLDDDFNRALSLAAWCYTLRPTQGWLSRDSDEAGQAIEMARKALAGEPDNPEVLWQSGYAIWFFSDGLLEGIDHIDRSLELNPNSAQAWVASGWARLFSGDPQTAIEHHSRAIELSPMDPIGYRPLNGIAAAYVCLGDYERAEQWSRKALALGPNYHGCYRVLATSLAYLDRTDEASEVIKKYLELVPQVSIAYYRKHMPWKDARYREIHEEGLRLAGLPEVSEA